MTSVHAGSSDIDSAWPPDAVEVGRIIEAWGLKGWLRVQSFAEDPQALFSSRRWFLRPAPRPGPQSVAGAVLPPLLRISQIKVHGDGIVAQAHDIADRTAAEALRGARIFVARTSFPTAGPDEYYWVDLIGLQVVNRQDQSLGQVIGLLDTGPHSVLRIAPPGVPAEQVGEAAERLIPFVSAYVDSVSLEQRRIVVDWGLDY